MGTSASTILQEYPREGPLSQGIHQESLKDQSHGIYKPAAVETSYFHHSISTQFPCGFPGNSSTGGQMTQQSQVSTNLVPPPPLDYFPFQKEVVYHNENNKNIYGGAPPTKQTQQMVHSHQSPSDTSKPTKLVQTTVIESEEYDDGYRWRKYGSKTGKKANRSYHKCCHPSCEAKKITETITADGKTVTTVIQKAPHNHQPPTVTSIEVFTQEDFKKQVMKSTSIDPFHNSSDPLPKLTVETTLAVNPLEDGFHWRKYGQKALKGSDNPRSYFKCTVKNCKVKKQVEKNETIFVITYDGVHHHPSSDHQSLPASPALTSTGGDSFIEHVEMIGQFNLENQTQVGEKRTFHPSDGSEWNHFTNQDHQESWISFQ